MPIVRLDGKQISYWTGRKGFVEGREFILFIHGAGGGQYTWSCQKGFFEKEFNPIIIELPGHGESGGEGEKEVGKYAEEVYAFLQRVGVKKVFLVGHSMGGAIVQTLALTHPEIIRGIILVGTGARLRVLPLILNGMIDNFRETIPRIVQYAYSPKAPPELIKEGVNQLLQCRPEVLQGDYSACDRFDVMKEVEKINLPALILCGEDDALTPVLYSQYLHSRIKGSKLEILPHAGHMIMVESFQAFNEKIREFVVMT